MNNTSLTYDKQNAQNSIDSYTNKIRQKKILDLEMKITSYTNEQKRPWHPKMKKNPGQNKVCTIAPLCTFLRIENRAKKKDTYLS